jgi:hypothetical protein
MKNILKFLLALNDALYLFQVHIPVFIIWIACILFQVPYLASWFKIGVGVYLVLLVWRLIQDRRIMPLKTKNDLLAYLVGLNISVVLGLLSFPIIGLLFYFSKEEK